jgi:hypothetical protein
MANPTQITLCQELRMVDHLPEVIADFKENGFNFISEYSRKLNMPGSSVVFQLDIPNFPEPNYDELQKQLILRRTNEVGKINQLASRAIQSPNAGLIEYTFDQLSWHNKGLRRVLPRRKNSYTNYKVQCLSEIVGDVSGLKHNGIFKMDNVLSGIMHCLPAGYWLARGVSAFAKGPVLASGMEQLEYQFLDRALDIIGALWGTMAGASMGSNARYVSLDIQENAKYVDGKIKTLFGDQE